jgi:hypothetical protein
MRMLMFRSEKEAVRKGQKDRKYYVGATIVKKQ